MMLRKLQSVRLIFLVALVLRLYFLSTYVQPRSQKALGAIPFLFEPGNIAFSLATGHGFASPFRTETGPTAWMTPVYPGILAALFRIFGTYTYDAFLSAALLNIAFSALAIIPLYFAAKRLAGPTLAATAAWLWAIFPNALILPYEALWDASLGALLATTILWATLALRDSNRLRDWIAYGLLWGFTLMTTAALGALLPFLLIWLCVSGPSARILRLAGSTAAIAILSCIPWTVRNYQTFHALVPLRTVMGLSLWLGNNEKADGISTANLHPISNSAERAHYVEIGEIAYNSEKQQAALHFIRAHPARALEFSARRFVAIWSGGTAHPFDDFLRNHDLWFRWVLAFNLLAAAAATTGLVLLARAGNPFFIPLAVFPLIFPLAYYITLAPPRYRHPIDPAIMLLAAVTLQAIWQTVRSTPALKSRALNNK
jgi:hypothetical protein